MLVRFNMEDCDYEVFKRIATISRTSPSCEILRVVREAMPKEQFRIAKLERYMNMCEGVEISRGDDYKNIFVNTNTVKGLITVLGPYADYAIELGADGATWPCNIVTVFPSLKCVQIADEEY